jgi:hypothetical protein
MQQTVFALSVVRARRPQFSGHLTSVTGKLSLPLWPKITELLSLLGLT